jgi:hypothetical protein
VTGHLQATWVIVPTPDGPIHVAVHPDAPLTDEARTAVDELGEIVRSVLEGLDTQPVSA